MKTIEYFLQGKKIDDRLNEDGLFLSEHLVAVIDGVERLHGCAVKACDLRAGAAMVIAGLAADGVTTVEDAHYIERGYETMIEKLRGLGADISRVETPDKEAGRSAG